jgi:hypothetical protein
MWYQREGGSLLVIGEWGEARNEDLQMEVWKLMEIEVAFFDVGKAKH